MNYLYTCMLKWLYSHTPKFKKIYLERGKIFLLFSTRTNVQSGSRRESYHVTLAISYSFLLYWKYARIRYWNKIFREQKKRKEASQGCQALERMKWDEKKYIVRIVKTFLFMAQTITCLPLFCSKNNHIIFVECKFLDVSYHKPRFRWHCKTLQCWQLTDTQFMRK